MVGVLVWCVIAGRGHTARKLYLEGHPLRVVTTATLVGDTVSFGTVVPARCTRADSTLARVKRAELLTQPRSRKVHFLTTIATPTLLHDTAYVWPQQAQLHAWWNVYINVLFGPAQPRRFPEVVLGVLYDPAVCDPATAILAHVVRNAARVLPSLPDVQRTVSQ